MSKFVTLSFMIIASLFLFSSLAYATKPHHVLPNDHSPVAVPTIQHEDQHIIDEIEGEELGGVEINCEGVGEEECLMVRRTLVAHTDYIYTQKKNKP